MSKETTNPEGLTFGEWVLAAGRGVFDHGNVRLYTSSETRYYAPRERLVEKPYLMLVNGIVVPKHLPKRVKTTWYSKKLRDAWRSGEDPTEYRGE